MLKNIIFTVLLVFMTGCAVTKTAYTERTQVMLMSEEEELSIGESEAKKILQSSKVSSDWIAKARVERIGKRIAEVSEKDYNWEFHLIEEDVLNAFCLPGGKVFVYTGILKVAENDDQLATVMSHEIAHALARHGAERVSMAKMNQVGHTLLSAVLNIENPAYKQIFDTAYGVGTNVALMLPHSRDNESEADYIGLVLMAKAGYDPKEAIGFWENMKKQKGSSEQIPFLSTHPTDDKRIEDIRASLPKVMNEVNR